MTPNSVGVPSTKYRCHSEAMNLRNHERFDLARMRDMRADTQIDHRATAIHSRGSAVGYLRLDEIFLVFVILRAYESMFCLTIEKTYPEHLEQVLFRDNEPLKLLLLLDSAITQLL